MDSKPRVSQPRFFPLAPRALRRYADAGSAARPVVPEGLFGWRLLGRNNWELGRSTAAYPGDGWRAAARAVQELASELVVDVVPTDPQTWNWSASAGDRVLATSARPFQRRRECSYNAERFVTALKEAIIPDEARP